MNMPSPGPQREIENEGDCWNTITQLLPKLIFNALIRITIHLTLINDSHEATLSAVVTLFLWPYLNSAALLHHKLWPFWNAFSMAALRLLPLLLVLRFFRCFFVVLLVWRQAA